MLQSILKPDRNFLGKTMGLLVSLGFLLWKCLWSEGCPTTFDIASYLHQTSATSSVVRSHYLTDWHCCAQEYLPPCPCLADLQEMCIGTAWEHQASWARAGPPTWDTVSGATHLSFNTHCCSGRAPLPFPGFPGAGMTIVVMLRADVPRPLHTASQTNAPQVTGWRSNVGVGRLLSLCPFPAPERTPSALLPTCRGDARVAEGTTASPCSPPSTAQVGRCLALSPPDPCWA